MKKIITTIVFLALSTFSAKAIDLPSLPDFGGLSLTAGVAANSSIWGAQGKESEFSETGTDAQINKESGIFHETYESMLIELGIGQYFSLGYEHTPGSLSTPENKNNEGKATPTTVKVDFNDLNTIYVKLNMPFNENLYVKAGTTEVDLDIKETTASGNTYANQSTSGTSLGLGYQKFIGDRGLSFRVEGNYMEFDNVKTNNGIATSGNRNEIDVKNLEGLNLKAALTYTFGKN
jgi:hypothetical protein